MPSIYIIVLLSRSCVSFGLATVRLCVRFGRPLFLFPEGFQYNACFGVLVSDVLRSCPKYFHLLNIVDLIGSAFALLWTSSLVMNSFHLMLSLRKHLAGVELVSFCSLFGCLLCFRAIENTSITLLLKSLILLFVFIPFDL